MTTVERGRFCNSCQKVVTDFRQMDAAEVIDFLKINKTGCGRFRNEQLNRPLQAVLQTPKYFITPFYKKIAASLLFFTAFAEKTFAQQVKAKTTQEANNTKQKSTTKTIRITGSITDLDSGKIQVGKDVYFSCGDLYMQATTNKNGWFSFTIPSDFLGKTAQIYAELSTGISVPKVEFEIKQNLAPFELYQMKAERLEKLEILVYQRPHAVTSMGGYLGGSERQSLLVDLPSISSKKKSIWYRLTHPFAKRKKNAAK